MDSVPFTKRERHIALRTDADRIAVRLQRMIAAHELFVGRADNLRSLLVDSQTLIEALAAELRVPK